MNAFEQKLPEIAAFVRGKLPGVEEWPTGRLEDWLRWYWEHGWLCVILDAQKAVAGIGAARPIHAGQEDDRTAFDEAGDTAWVDIAIAAERKVTAGLWQTLLARIGARQWLGYHRASRNDAPCRYPFDKFQERILA